MIPFPLLFISSHQGRRNFYGKVSNLEVRSLEIVCELEYYSDRYPIPFLTSPLTGGGTYRFPSPSGGGAGWGWGHLYPAASSIICATTSSVVNPFRSMEPERQEAVQTPHPLHRALFTCATSFSPTTVLFRTTSIAL